jgi:dsRNA-specific ribonuclease
MNIDKIQEFFLLKNNSPLFEVAIRPPSCGGGAEFEQLALYGDLAINWHLYDYLIGKDRKRKGDITACKGTIHHWTVIKAFADEFLDLPDILDPLDINHKPQDEELAETVEALIGAAVQSNDIESCKPIVHFFIEFALDRQKNLHDEGEFDPSQNYFGQLLQLFKDPN